jgi:16S rRNA (guanine1516-N2)-methyltransferase
MLDCTLGFASEAILAAIIVGESGKVVGLESTPELAYVTQRGLLDRPMTQKRMIAPMRRIEVVCADYRSYIESLEANVFDVIYFDPFFQERIDGSAINIDPLYRFGNTAPLDTSTVIQAITKARKRVVVKHPRDIALPVELRSLVTRVVSRAHGPIAYSVFNR